MPINRPRALQHAHEQTTDASSWFHHDMPNATMPTVTGDNDANAEKGPFAPGALMPTVGVRNLTRMQRCEMAESYLAEVSRYVVQRYFYPFCFCFC
jgi:hypothetical protein